ncbi:MAG: uroporphyrinogen-III synthase [Candidatus Dormibacteria bacterium]
MSSAAPLRGRRVLVTRGEEKADRLTGLLEVAGAEVVRVPLIAAQRLVAAAAISDAVDRLVDASAPGTGPAWLVLTSATGAEMTVEAVGAVRLGELAIAVVGPATAAPLRSHGIEPDLVAAGQVGESLASELVSAGVDGSPALLVTAAGARRVIAPLLEAAGAHVDVLEAYRSVMPETARRRLREALGGPAIDAVTFTSGSTVRHFSLAWPPPLPRCPAACIGPVTARAARAAGWATVIAATEHTADGLAAALLAHLAPVHPVP